MKNSIQNTLHDQFLYMMEIIYRHRMKNRTQIHMYTTTQCCIYKHNIK